jgi:hypothetical protein
MATIKAIQAEIATIGKIFPHLEFGSAVSPAMPDGADLGTHGRKDKRKNANSSTAARKSASERNEEVRVARRKRK